MQRGSYNDRQKLKGATDLEKLIFYKKEAFEISDKSYIDKFHWFRVSGYPKIKLHQNLQVMRVLNIIVILQVIFSLQ